MAQQAAGRRPISRVTLRIGAWAGFALLCAGICGISLVERYNLLLRPATTLQAELASLGISLQFHAA